MRFIERLRRRSVAAEVGEELEFHLEMAVRDLMQRGLTRQQARAEAERRFGDSRMVNEACQRYGNERDRKERRAEYFVELRQDVAFSVRQLAKNKSFTMIAVVTLALGIGATAAMFSALDAVVLRRLPYPSPDRIVNIHPQYDGEDGALTPPEFLAFRDVSAFEHVAAARLGAGATLKTGEFPEIVEAALVSADYFAVFGVRPLIGRTFTRDEDVAGGPGAVVLSQSFWASHYNSDPSVLNRVVQMNEKPYTIVGVMPASFERRNGARVWMPLALGGDDATKFGAHYLNGVARLRPGVTIEQARAAARATMQSVAERIPGRSRPLAAYGADIRQYAVDMVRDYRALLFILFGAVSFVLLIACGNVANLLLARGTTRARELAIRAALGAGRGRLFRQLLTESVVLAIAGAAAGLGVAFALIRVLRAVAPQEIPRIEQATVDWRVLGMTLLLGVGSSLLFGLAPAIRATRRELQQAIREGGRGAGGGRDRLRPLLIGSQVALTLALLTGAALLIRSAWEIQHVDPGFDPRGVLTARILLPDTRYRTGADIVRAFTRIREEASAIPEAKSVALTSVVPLSGSKIDSPVKAEGDTRPGRGINTNLRFTSDGYFDTMRIPLIAGRDIATTDVADGTPVAVISVSLARALWPGIDPRQAIGKRVSSAPTRRTDLKYWEVVGVVADLHDAALTTPPVPEMHTPVTQVADAFWPFLGRSLVVVVRHRNANAPAEALIQPLKRSLARVDPSVPLADNRSMESYLAESLATARMNTLLLSLLGGIALVLATVGIYGVVAYFVSQRTQEIGIRIALGSTPRDIWTFVVRRGMTPVIAGLVAGVALSLATSTLLRAQLFGVTSSDPVALIGSGVLLLVVALVAMYAPARRAIRVSPIVALVG
jgi:predicted permease